MEDSFGRRISYLRLSITDRCNLRCQYCMGNDVRFWPRSALMTFEELTELVAVFVGLGVRKLRLTGGEPLLRHNVEKLIGHLGLMIGHGLDELTVTTNGTTLARHAAMLKDAGVRRINVSLDTLDPDRYRAITRTGNISEVLRGIDAARAAGLSIKINTVALADQTEAEVESLARWCGANGLDLTFIEVMPTERGYAEQKHHLPMDLVKARLERLWHLVPAENRTGGPARYFRVPDLGLQIGFIAPLSYNFCSGCNRVRLDARGRLRHCLGYTEATDLGQLLRSGSNRAELRAAIAKAITLKPPTHVMASQETFSLTMSRVGG